MTRRIRHNRHIFTSTIKITAFDDGKSDDTQKHKETIVTKTVIEKPSAALHEHDGDDDDDVSWLIVGDYVYFIQQGSG